MYGVWVTTRPTRPPEMHPRLQHGAQTSPLSRPWPTQAQLSKPDGKGSNLRRYPAEPGLSCCDIRSFQLSVITGGSWAVLTGWASEWPLHPIQDLRVPRLTSPSLSHPRGAVKQGGGEGFWALGPVSPWMGQNLGGGPTSSWRSQWHSSGRTAVVWSWALSTQALVDVYYPSS